MKLRSCFIGIKAFSLAELFEGFGLFLVGINQKERKLSEKKWEIKNTSGNRCHIWCLNTLNPKSD